MALKKREFTPESGNVDTYEHEKVNVIEITAMDVIRGLTVVKREINRPGQKRSEIRW